MIDVKVPLYGMEESVVRPIVLSVVEDVKKLLGLRSDIYLQLTEDDKIKKKINKLGELEVDNNTKTEWLELTWKEQSEPDFELSTIPANPDYQPIWKDEELSSRAMPVYHPRKLNIRFVYHCMSKSGIQAIGNTLRAMTANDGHTTRHDIEYFYNVGDYFTNLLMEINNLKNKRLPNDQQLELEQYIYKTFDDRADIAWTYDGDSNKCELIIREAQLQCNGYIEDDVYNIEVTYDTDISQWSIEFNYTVSYDKPTNLNLRYPIMVYNTIMPEQFRYVVKEENKSPLAIRTGRMSAIEKVVNQPKTFKPLVNNDFIRIPKSDVVRLPDPPRMVSRMFSVLTVMDTANPTMLFNLKDIPGVKFKDEILDILLKSEYPYVGEILYSLFYIQLFEGECKQSNIKVLLDSEGNLTTDQPMDVKKTYRVVFNIINDLNFLRPEASGRYRKYIADQIDAIDLGGAYKDPFNLTYYSIFSLNTDIASETERLKYAKEDITFRVKDSNYGVMKTKAWGHIIAMERVLEWKNQD